MFLDDTQKSVISGGKERIYELYNLLIVHISSKPYSFPFRFSNIKDERKRKISEPRPMNENLLLEALKSEMRDSVFNFNFVNMTG